MLVIYQRLFRDRASSLILFCLIGMLLVWLYFLFFPLLVQQSDTIRGFMESLPTVLLKAFGMEDLNIFSIEGFLTYKHYNATLPLLIIILLVSLAGSGLCAEIERGTIETALACPISRLRIFLGIYLAGIVSLLVFIICAVLSVVPAGAVLGVEYKFGYHFSVAILGCFFGWAVFSLAMLISALSSQVRRAYMILASILFGMYIIYLISITITALSWLKYFSLFGYYEPNIILQTQMPAYASLYVFTAVAVICTSLGVYHFNKRDICL